MHDDIDIAFAPGARFEQAKKPTKSAQFLQIVARPKPASSQET